MATEKRLIEAKYLTSQMYLICEVCQTENIFIDAIIDEIDNAPDVDAVEVVRCKDCKHYMTIHCTCDGCCISDDWYCADGERKDNA